ncbi:hypothetical protein [Phaeobacter gallaeciensis]|uniref:hypothetical protein n=1 Tax=Phaeobacter gallaeciensis TaxID=60890 RepID=UPI00237F2350|nr:hypothetical protein [Phaeobacter gallaeciensis]MDE4191249.1 hypothetical protein [Phaeobacter gallaeciensis]MDE4199714.1 hypothetical protein [Phaeobacter gallaeciensis]MDE4203862.1 hypothetical protein [Phaeobacter gallaeciensis]MDE4208004.1 hypothetical protein [Phaeobacter gallaeciensis]MDE4216371.1 hypothetical protein [Phaeobacter gallaeciensis]
MTGLQGDAQADIAKAVSRILVVQAVTSGLVAIAIVVGAIYLSTQTGGVDLAFELLRNWGGVVIGFYFGTAYAQISNLVRATGGGAEKPQQGSG